MDSQFSTYIGLGVPVVTAIGGWAFLNARPTITYEVTALGFLGSSIYGPGLVDDEHSYERFEAARIEIRNRGLKHLQNVSLKYDNVGPKWIARVHGTTTIPPESLNIELSKRTLTITMFDMPRSERVSIDLLHKGGSNYLNTSLRGGGSAFQVREASSYIFRKATGIALTLSLMAVLANLVLALVNSLK